MQPISLKPAPQPTNSQGEQISPISRGCCSVPCPHSRLWWLSQAVGPWVQSRVLQTQQMLCPVDNHFVVKLTREREIKPL